MKKKFIAIVIATFIVAIYIAMGAGGGTGFTSRTTAPDLSNPHFTARNPFYWSGLGMPNCTAYAWGRAYEILGFAPPLNLGNAGYWFYNNGGTPHANDNFARGQEPKLGAIAVWGPGAFSRFGHVAVVEAINADGTVDISESHFGGAFFVFRRNVDVHHVVSWRPRPDNQNFLGFIYLCTTVDNSQNRFDIPAPPMAAAYVPSPAYIPPPIPAFVPSPVFCEYSEDIQYVPGRLFTPLFSMGIDDFAAEFTRPQTPFPLSMPQFIMPPLPTNQDSLPYESVPQESSRLHLPYVPIPSLAARAGAVSLPPPHMRRLLHSIGTK